MPCYKKAALRDRAMQLHDNTTCVRRGSQGDRSKGGSAPRPGREGCCTALLSQCVSSEEGDAGM